MHGQDRHKNFRRADTPNHPIRGGGDQVFIPLGWEKVRTMVGARGFEPPTPCSQSRCATGLRHTPFTNRILDCERTVNATRYVFRRCITIPLCLKAMAPKTHGNPEGNKSECCQ